MTKTIRLLMLFSLLVILLISVMPVSAKAVAQAGVCIWNGNTYYPGQYFYNSAGQQYLCYSDGSYRWTGVTIAPTYYYTCPVPPCSYSVPAPYVTYTYPAYTTTYTNPYYTYPTYTYAYPAYPYNPNLLTNYTYPYVVYYP